MRRRHFLVAIIVLVWVFALLPSCLEPTQITLDIRTDVRCDQAKGISITAGDQGSVQTAPPRLVSRDCSPDGRIGTLVVTPEGDRDADVAFRVVMGVDVPVEECTPEKRNKGCIEQKRLVSYVEHTPIELPIDMLLICLGVYCDPASTCAANGKCVPARVNPEDCKPPKRCIPGENGEVGVDGSVGEDGSVTEDGGISSDGPITTDGPVTSDAPNDQTTSSDAPKDQTAADAPKDNFAPDNDVPDAPMPNEGGVVVPMDGGGMVVDDGG